MSNRNLVTGPEGEIKMSEKQLTFECIECGKLKKGLLQNIAGTRCECGGPILEVPEENKDAGPGIGEKMREIKFRGKRIDNGEWICGYYFKAKNKDYILPIGNAIFLSNIEEVKSSHKTMYGFYEVISETVGQYTADKDITKKEIYEGDILHCLDDGTEFYSKVFYEDSTFLVCDNNGVKAPVVIYTGNWPAVCEKEGNIFDDPELIENVEKS